MSYYKKQTRQRLSSTLEEIKNRIYRIVATLDAEAWITKEPVAFEEKTTGEWRKIQIGEKWGELWDCAWFNFKGEVPQGEIGKKLVLLIDLSGEGCLFDKTGCPMRGLTNVSSEFEPGLGKPGKRVLQFTDNSAGGEKVDIWVEAGCNDLFGLYKDNGILKNAYIAECNEEMHQLYYDFYVLDNLLDNISEDSARYSSILYAMNEACNVLNEDSNQEEILKARDILKSELEKKGGTPSLTVSGIGHAHIDLAWLWPIRETIRKGARTFSTVLELMERYPDYIFGASQPQLYDWMKERYPQLYGKIKEKIEEQRWEAQGAMWVEADTNVSGGEALVRQMLYGKRFFRKEFGKDMKVCWLPDVFGYSAALPQILKKSGVDYFMTIKLSWSEHNEFPYHTFMWQGMDGSKVLTHMPPEGTYNSPASPMSIKKIEKNFHEKGISDEALVLFGIGDGGGGPGAEHLERLKREKNLEGIAPVKQEFSIDFFERIEKHIDRYKTWVGELYLEKHQGTYTTQAKNKWYNRKMEYALRELEFSMTIANLYSEISYEKEELDELWKETLLYQFHDILPGSSIKRVYDESLERYSIMHEKTEELINRNYLALSNQIDTKYMIKPYIAYNSLSWKRNEWLNVDGKWKKVTIPSLGYVVMDMAEEEIYEYNMFAGEDFVENDLLRVTFSTEGTIISIYDKENCKEVIPKGAVANRLSVYEDMGDAWDFPIYYDEKPAKSFKLINTEFFVDGPKAIMEQNYCFGNSVLKQRIVLTEGERHIDFITDVQWMESRKMLRTSFPVSVYSENVTCDIQFGNIKRSTHSNTSWDMAQYEICAHKWVNLSQSDYGVALMNDSKYGHKIKDNVIDLNLLRSSEYPGVSADRGDHTFVYSLYPHDGNEIVENINEKAYELNIAPRVYPVHISKGLLKKELSTMEISSNNIIVEAVKKAEDDNDVIVRLYESKGAATNCEVKFNLDISQVSLVNLMEESMEELPMEGNKINLSMKPFEICTLKIKNREF